MTILDEKGLSGILKKFLDLVFVGGAVIYVFLPLIIKWYIYILKQNNRESYYFILIFLYVTGLFALCICYEMRKIFKTLNRHNPFMMDNVTSLKRVSVFSFIISGCYVIKIICYNSILTMVITMLFIMLGLFLLVLSEVFKQAVEVKEENDLTI